MVDHIATRGWTDQRDWPPREGGAGGGEARLYGTPIRTPKKPEDSVVKFGHQESVVAKKSDAHTMNGHERGI